MWPEVEETIVKPPVIRRMPGRPKKKRRRAPEEKDPKCPQKKKRTGVQMTCQNCHQQGHNSRSCKNDPVEKIPKEKGKRGRPAKKIPQQNSLVGSSRGTRKEHPQMSISANANARQVANACQVKERALARKGVGVIGFEESGNIYMRMSSHNKVIHVNKEISSTSSSRIRQSNVMKVCSPQ
ncbi:uncharacterized protein LOC121771406 [Salvia splendens]|nr:uncharacterized protein LOC121771406 [Salvia splendens]